MAKGNGVSVGHQNDGFVTEEAWDRKDEKPRFSICSVTLPPGVRTKPRPSCVLRARQTRKSTQFLAAAAGMNVVLNKILASTWPPSDYFVIFSKHGSLCPGYSPDMDGYSASEHGRLGRLSYN